MNLKAGITLKACTTKEASDGSVGNEVLHAKQVAAWGFDYVKYDGSCYVKSEAKAESGTKAKAKPSTKAAKGGKSTTKASLEAEASTKTKTKTTKGAAKAKESTMTPSVIGRFTTMCLAIKAASSKPMVIEIDTA
jgi:hypothetical protein